MRADRHRLLGRVAALALWLACLGLAGCGSDPIVIGFLGPLEGKYSDLGVQGRNGALLAIEDLNERGGIAGRPLELMPLDDGGDETLARMAFASLTTARVAAVVGPMTSNVAMALVPLASAQNVTLVSPTVSTPLLGGKKDTFFRVVPQSAHWADALAHYAFTREGVETLAAVTDLDNAAFTLPYTESFLASFTDQGGQVLDDIRLHTSQVVDWRPIAERIAKASPEAVIATLSARDTAFLAREIRLLGLNVRQYGSMWAYTQEILQAGGRSVDGIVFSVGYDESNPLPAFREFKRRYEMRFGWPPNFAACFSYEAVMALARALEWTRGSATGLPEAMVALGRIDSLQGPMTFDEYGDVERAAFIMTIRERAFVTIDTIR